MASQNWETQDLDQPLIKLLWTEKGARLELQSKLGSWLLKTVCGWSYIKNWEVTWVEVGAQVSLDSNVWRWSGPTLSQTVVRQW